MIPTDLTRDDLCDLVVLATVARSERSTQRRSLRSLLPEMMDPHEAEARIRDLVRRCLLIPAPRAAIGYRVGVIGIARMQRFVRSSVGVAAEAAHLSEECALRRVVLDALDPEDREQLVDDMCRDLVDIRDELLSCSNAATCRVGACPFSAAASVEEVDMALVWLTRGTAPARVGALR